MVGQAELPQLSLRSLAGAARQLVFNLAQNTFGELPDSGNDEVP